MTISNSIASKIASLIAYKKTQGGTIMKKGGRKPTRAERKILVVNGLNPLYWIVEKNLTTSVHVVHREVGRRKEIAK